MRQRATSLDGFAAAVQTRVTAMTQIHSLLEQAHWGDVDLRDLVTGLLYALQRAAPHGIEVHVDGPPVAISSRQTLPLAMTLAELHANSCKYGAHAQATGRLLVSWRLERCGGRTTVTLLWRERGGAPITAEAAHSLGRDLVEGFVRHELGGSCDLRFPPEGAEHTIVFPVAGSPTPPAAPAP